MSDYQHRVSAAILPVLLISLLLPAACGAKQSPTGAMGAITTDTPLIPDADGNVNLPAPASLRSASSLPPRYFRRGVDYANDLPTSRLMPQPGGEVIFFPDWGASGNRLPGMAVYPLSSNGYGQQGQITLGWQFGGPQNLSNLWAALPNYENNRWEWHSPASAGSIAIGAENFQDGNTHLLLTLTGDKYATLESVALEVELPSPHDVITEGCSEVGGGLLMSRVSATADYLEPVLWGSSVATGGDKMGLQGTLPVPGWAGYFGNGRVSVWTGHAGLFGGNSDGNFDNDRFRTNWFSWLLDSGTRIGFSNTHNEWNSGSLSGYLQSWFTSEGISWGALDADVSAEVLADYDLLIVGNPWGAIADAEIDAIEQWVIDGGALFVWGLGWSYYQYNDDPDGSNYAVNRLGERFGWFAENGTIKDPEAPNGSTSEPTFAVAPLTEYTPAEVVVLNKNEVDVNTVKDLAISEPENIYVIEGDYMGFQAPTSAWAELSDPAAMINLFDETYLKHLELVDDRNRAYGGDKIWYISKYDPDGSYWMHSGNPIVMKDAAAESTINIFNTEGTAGWGCVHEQGHNMVISACGNLFVHSGTAEEWCNVFTVYVFGQFGWDPIGDPYDDGYNYHHQPNPDFSELTSSNWILLGCLKLIWDKYGWDGTKAFMAQAAEDKAAGASAGDNAAKTAYFVEELSHAYEIDFAALIEHWGFPVSDDSKAITSVYPPAEIPWD